MAEQTRHVSGKERRSYERVRLLQHVTFWPVQDPKLVFEGTVRDASGDGLYVYTPVVLPMHSAVGLSFVLPPGGVQPEFRLNAVARVVRTELGPQGTLNGMALAFGDAIQLTEVRKELN